ncbi:TPA: hypothetical protein ACKRFB_003610 [Proteus mirabilis]
MTVNVLVSPTFTDRVAGSTAILSTTISSCSHSTVSASATYNSPE